VVLLWISTTVDWGVARAIHRAKSPGRRRALLMLSLATNLGILGYFKYGAFLLENFVSAVHAAGIAYEPAAPDIVLPVGISFYTFQTLAYSLDVYLEREEPAESPLDFALFVTFFPQLVAGPIVRPSQLIPQFARPRRTSLPQFGFGLFLITLGLFEKVVVADGMLSPAVDTVYGADDAVAWGDAWLGTLAFSGQIFCDFAGYSTAAIGCALTLGFSLPDNFRFPYAAVGFSDFWRRWHISLSTWLRDYLYIPLGGNRRGRRRTAINLMITMLLGGLWHGASWTFVAWGALHGFYLGAERWLRARFGDRDTARRVGVRVGLAVLTYLLVNAAWVFFRAPDFATAARLLGAMTGLGEVGARVLHTYPMTMVIGAMLPLLTVHMLMRDRKLHQVIGAMPLWLFALGWGALLVLIIITQGSGDAFIYFQF
jgi:alginate O-acetyltransferase complex protein AlgI